MWNISSVSELIAIVISDNVNESKDDKDNREIPLKLDQAIEFE